MPKPSKKQAAKNANPSQIVDLNFKVPYEFKKQMRLFALEHDMKVVDVLKLAFERLKRDRL